jgi:hypothetical protein
LRVAFDLLEHKRFEQKRILGAVLVSESQLSQDPTSLSVGIGNGEVDAGVFDDDGLLKFGEDELVLFLH